MCGDFIRSKASCQVSFAPDSVSFLPLPQAVNLTDCKGMVGLSAARAGIRR